MQLLQKLLNKFNGLYYKQEYLCLAKETLEQQLQLYLISGRRIIEEITDQHAFVGYHPLVFALTMSDATCMDSITVAFSAQTLDRNAILSEKDALAVLELKKIRQQSLQDNTVCYYEGNKGKHHFIPGFNQFIISLNNRLYNKKPGNVFLHDNLYKQVQIAYSLPRIISLITVRQNGLFNLFPTDLHGPAGRKHYILSLRHQGKACNQVEKAGRVLLSELHCNAFKTAYGLGKNHMQEPKEFSHFPFSRDLSAQLQLPVPEDSLHYRELEIKESFIHGIHRLFLCEVLYASIADKTPATLAHIHNSYATWRYNKGLSGNYLLR